MAIISIELGKWNIILVFRHRWEKFDDGIEKYTHHRDWREWRLGLWFKHNKILGKRVINRSHLVNSYMIGIDLLVCRLWIDWDKNGVHLGE